MALVYKFMPNGSLYDHLHKRGTNFTWSQLLKICIGAAHGLDYLHNFVGTEEGVIHRDVKSANILLDQNYAAKIADFGLAKIGPTNQTNTEVITKFGGSHGYADPNYFNTGTLTRRSDIYSFGVVLCEVLSRRIATSFSMGLANWAKDLIKQRKRTQIISSRLSGRISKSSLKEFTDIAARCLRDDPDERPAIRDVIGCLIQALAFQEGITIKKSVWSFFSFKGYFELRSSRPTESNDINGGTVIVSENVSIPVPATVSSVVQVDQREPLEVQDGNQSESNLVDTSLLIPPINTPPFASTSATIETGVTGIKESLRISNREIGVSGVELENPHMHDHLPEQEEENNTPGQVGAERTEECEPGVHVTLLALPDGTNELKRVRFSRRIFDIHQSQTWWSENRENVYRRYDCYIYPPAPPPSYASSLGIHDDMTTDE